MRKRSFILLLLLILVLAAALVAGCAAGTGGQGGTSKQGTNKKPKTIELSTVKQWVSSAHARPITFAAEEEGCKNCHDGQTFTETGGGFQPRMSGGTTGSGETSGTEGERDWVVATDCRVCHTGPGVQFAKDGKISGVPSLDSAQGGVGAVCMACHNGWHPAGARNGELGAPHGSVQTDMFFGVNTLDVAASGGSTGTAGGDSRSVHSKVTNTCVGCHMTAKGSSTPNHTFKPSFSGCQRRGCHKGDMTGGGKAKQDYDNDGTTENYQTEVEGLLASLKQAINASAGTTDFKSQAGQVVFQGGQVGANDPEYVAAYNYLFVVDDRSRGVHNPKFTVQLLQDSIQAVSGGGAGGGSTTTTP